MTELTTSQSQVVQLEKALAQKAALARNAEIRRFYTHYALNVDRKPTQKLEQRELNRLLRRPGRLRRLLSRMKAIVGRI